MDTNKEMEDILNVKFRLYPKEILDLRECVINCNNCGKNDTNKEKHLVNIFEKYKYCQDCIDSKYCIDSSGFLPITTNYWTDACCNVPADIVFMGQDWGGTDSVESYIFNDRNEGGNPTRDNLEAGIKKIGCREKSFFINSVLCLREGKDTEGNTFNPEFIECCKENIKKHMAIIKPKIIVTMGQEVSGKYITTDFCKGKKFGEIASKPYWNETLKCFIFPIFHLGSWGQKNRERYADKESYSYKDYLLDFDLMAYLLISYCVVELFRNKENTISDLNDLKGLLVKRVPVDNLLIDKFIENVKNISDSLDIFKTNKEDDKASRIKLIYEKLICNFVFGNAVSNKLNSLKKYKTYWFINAGEIDNDIKKQVRFWKDNKNYGFVSFGHGGINLNLKSEIRSGDYAFIYISGKGYVGCGGILDTVNTYDNFITVGGKRLDKLYLSNQEYLKEEMDNPDMCEYFVSIKWDKALEKNNAIPYESGYSFPTTFCKINNSNIVKHLIEKFNSK
jgi:uracil-DNA glycosylase family 4